MTQAMARLLVVLGLFSLCVTPVLPPAAHSADINPLRFVLPNGLTVLVLEQHSLPIVQIHTLIRAGGAHDPADKAGVANLTASLLDEGTANRTAKQIAEQIEFVGGSLSARTSEDFTTASVKVLKKDVELGFELLGDILLHPAFPEQEFDRVRNQILGEIQSERDDPAQVAAKAFKQVVFPGHPYRWPVNGTEETLPKIKRADDQQFYAREYVPNQTIMTIVGDVTADQARAHVMKRFGGWKRGDAPTRPAAPARGLEKPVLKLIEKDLTQATILLGHVGISRTNPDYYAVTVMNYILGAGGFSSRLMETIRDNQGLAYHVASHFEANVMPGPFVINLQTRNEAANQAISGVLAELNRIREAPVSDPELADAKAYLVGSFALRLDTTSKLAEVLALVELYGLGLDYFTKYPKLIEQVTKDDVLRVAKQYLHPNRYALVVVANQTKAKVKS
jgi:zinc protease